MPRAGELVPARLTRPVVLIPATVKRRIILIQERDILSLGGDAAARDAPIRPLISPKARTFGLMRRMARSLLQRSGRCVLMDFMDPLATFHVKKDIIAKAGN